MVCLIFLLNKRGQPGNEIGVNKLNRLDAQRATIERFAAERGAEITGRFTEVESGGRADRPELERALQLARLTGATLVIAKLDRLSRNAAFLLTLRDSGVRFLACDMPEANDLTVGIMALVAQQECEAISRRTKEALAAAKARGVRLGNPNGAAALRRAGKDGAALTTTVARNADAFAGDLAPVFDAIRAAGHTSLRAMAAERDARGIRTRRGGAWHVSTVMNLVRRIEDRKAPDDGLQASCRETGRIELRVAEVAPAPRNRVETNGYAFLIQSAARHWTIQSAARHWTIESCRARS